MSRFDTYLGDSRQIILTLPEASIDSVVTDAPYEIGFMGREWDKTGIAVNPEVWRACYQVLKPGGYLLSFAGARTYHRIACAIEDAGFEIRDQIMWIYGSGMPKNLNVSKSIEAKLLFGKTRTEDLRRMRMGEDYVPSGRGRKNYDHGNGSAMDAAPAEFTPSIAQAKQWEGWGTALKPAHEPIVVARKPLVGTVAENVMQYGTGAINIDGCRVNPGVAVSGGGNNFDAWRSGEGRDDRPESHGKRSEGHNKGRWPANIMHDGSDEVLSYFPDAKGQQGAITGAEPSSKTKEVYGEFAGRIACTPRIESEKSAARFFYCPKATKKDRGEGNTWPTVKPTELMRYLCCLVTPPEGTILDPFMGSGSTGKAAFLEGFSFIGIDIEESAIAIARTRLGSLWAE
jgi:site-specific DNA-methyltransferase (adenine-specific)